MIKVVLGSLCVNRAPKSLRCFGTKTEALGWRRSTHSGGTPVRTHNRFFRYWSLLLTRPAPHLAVFAAENGERVEVDLRPSDFEKPPVHVNIDADGNEWKIQAVSLWRRRVEHLNRRQMLDTDAMYRAKVMHGGYTHWVEEWELILWGESDTGSSGRQCHEQIVVCPAEDTELRKWTVVADGRAACFEYRYSGGRVRQKPAMLGREYEAFLAAAALAEMRGPVETLTEFLPQPWLWDDDAPIVESTCASPTVAAGLVEKEGN